MWTYLLIFLSILALVIVFAHRAYFVLIKKKDSEEAGRKMEPAMMEEENAPEKKRLKKDEKAEMEKLYNRALAMIKKREPKEAVKALVQCLAINPEFLDAQKQLGMLYIDQKMWGKGAAVYQYLASKTNDPVDFSHLGLCLYSNGDLDGAANAYQQAVTLDPERVQRYISLAQVYRDAGKDQLGLIAINKALEFDKSNLEYWLLAADLNMQLGNLMDARGAINRAIEIAPMSKVARKMLEDLAQEEKKGRE